jgi:Peptidase family S41
MRLLYLPLTLLALSPLHADDLLVGRLAPRIHSVVYDLPGIPAAQTGMLAGMIRQQFPQAETLDASTATDDVLHAKLQKTFLLITLLDPKSRLLPLVAQPLSFKLENGAVRWDDFTGPVKTLRVDFVGRNPFGTGYAIVKAVDSLAGFQAGDDGQYSYQISNAEGVLRKGTYDEDFTPTPRGRMKLADAQADLRELFSTLERIHAALFARVAEQDYRRMKDQTLVDLQARADRNGLVAVEDLAYIVRYAVSFVRDGHTESLWGARPYQEPIDHSRFPPFRFEFENGRFYITGAIDASLAGLELVSVNGAPTAQFLAPALDRISGEILPWRATRLADNQDFWLWFTNVVGKTPGCCRLGLRDVNGAETSRNVEPVTIAQFGKIRTTAGRKFTRSNSTQVRFFDSGKVAQFLYPGFHYSDAEFKKIDDIFRQIREAKSQDLIVDLRSNGGGQVQMGSLIFSYISSKPVPQFSSGRIRISREAMQDLATEITYGHDGEVVTITDIDAFGKMFANAFKASVDMPKQREPFAGRLWLLVDHRTFSAANIFSMTFRDGKLGAILGYETGQPADICGDPLLSFTLKHSEIPYRVTASANFVKDPGPGVAEHGVLPDVPFDRKLLAPFRAEPDPELAYALDYIQKHR